MSFNFKVNVNIERPAIYANSSPDPLRDKTPSPSSSVRAVPARHQYVEVHQDTSFSGNSFIGGAFTDSNGTLDNVTFTVSDHYPNIIYLIIRGDSQWGFRVGSNSEWPHEQLDVAIAYQWITPPVPGGTSEINVGTVSLGKLGSSWTFPEYTTSTITGNQVNSFRAAALFEILDMIYAELGFYNLPSNWIINDVMAEVAGSQTPWVYWGTVHIRDDIITSKILEVVPHELGHVLYNYNHSGKLHYDVEDWMDYLHPHNACDNLGPHFGHYEGYAYAFSDLFWRHHAQRLGKPDYNNPPRKCTTAGIAREGNVNEFYCYAFAGIPMERSPDSLYAWTTHLIGANKYAFPPTYKLWEIVGNQLTEDLNEMWLHSMKNMPGNPFNGVPTFFNSRRFKCLVKNTMISSSDNFSDEFKNVNCMPGKSNIINYTTSPETIQVEFSSAEYVNSYEVIAWPAGHSQKAFSVNPDQYGQDTLIHSVNAPNCSTVRLVIRTSNEHGSTFGDAIEVEAACNLTKPVINNVTKLAFSNGFRIELAYTPSPEAEEHRYELVGTVAGIEHGPYSEFPNNVISFYIYRADLIENGLSYNPVEVAVQARRYNKVETSDYIQISFYPVLVLQPRIFIPMYPIVNIE